MWLFGEVLLLLWERKLYKRGNIRENKIPFNSKLPCPSTLTQQISWAKNISRLYGAKRKNIPSSASPPSLRQHTRTDMFPHTAHVDVSCDENDLQFKGTDLPGGCCKGPANILLCWWSQSRGGRADWLTHCCRCLQKGTSGYLFVSRTLSTAPSPSHLWNQRKIPVGTSHQSRQGWRAGNGVDLITYVNLQFKSSFSFDRAGVWSGCGRCSREQGTCKSEGQRDHHLSQRGEHAVPTENPDQRGRLRGILFFPGALTCQCPSACAALQHPVVLLYKGSHLLFFFFFFFVLCASSRH